MASNQTKNGGNVLPQGRTPQQLASHTQGAKPAGEASLSARIQHHEQLREDIVRSEAAMGFEYACSKTATKNERLADKILQQIKEDDMSIYKHAGVRKDSLGQEHPHFYGDHFLSNVRLIEKTGFFRLCQAMPKGAHLHIHFNANLAPGFLLGIAKQMSHMYIWSSEALTGKAAFDSCRIQFSILGDQELRKKNPAGPANLFDPRYSAYQQQNPGCGWMLFRDFIRQFPQVARRLPGVDPDVDRWLQYKLVFHEEETHNSLQTAAGAWQNFNARTQMMKGLFNYRTAYERYTRACLAQFVQDNIQYAEIRPNFMSTNQVWEDDGSSRLDNEAIMRLIISEYERFQKEHRERVFKGLKVIYCTPRSFDREKVELALKECLEFKKKFPAYIAGFDLVGEEARGHPLRYFTAEFLQFQADCAAAGENIPFLFHCGETLEHGTETDGNLFDALLLGAKRIGHGFALPRHPLVMQEMKKRRVCVELCPISNEILGLTPRISGHAAYTLLANNVPCTISTDNSTPFRSTLSHDFYQIMAGKRDMTLFGLRQLVEWSIEHSCMEASLKTRVHREWETMWADFVGRIIRGEFGGRGTAASSSSSASGSSSQGQAHGYGQHPTATPPQAATAVHHQSRTGAGGAARVQQPQQQHPGSFGGRASGDAASRSRPAAGGRPGSAAAQQSQPGTGGRDSSLGIRR